MSSTQQAIQTYKTTNPKIVFLPGEEGYEASARVFVAIGKPAIVVQPQTTTEIKTAIQFARDHSLTVSVRCGGHSGAGHSTNDNGIVIDMGRIKNVEVVDETRRLVRVGGGALWGDVAHTLQEHNLAISSGDTKSVGVGGLTLGGGIGWMVRAYGLALDSLVGVELVTAQGDIVHASQDEHPDLFWAVRGGGGNFGIATSFEFIAQPIHTVYTGLVTYNIADLGTVLRRWRDYMRTAPEELTAIAMVMPANPAFGNMPASLMLHVCYAGDDESAAQAAIKPLTQLGTPIHQDIQPKAYADVLQEAHPPKDMRIITNNAFFREFSDELIDTIGAHTGLMLQIRSVGGAMNRVAPDATAFAHRDSEVLIVAPAFVAADADDEVVQKTLEPWQQIAAFGHGAYVNFLSEDTPQNLASSYPPATLQRLTEVKRQYDPDNIFHCNFNISPEHS